MHGYMFFLHVSSVSDKSTSPSTFFPGYLERLCVNNGADTIFVLSTQTMQWFREKGFYPAGIDALPPSRRRVYDYARNSKIYVKGIDGPKDLEAQEQLWDR